MDEMEMSQKHSECLGNVAGATTDAFLFIPFVAVLFYQIPSGNLT
jgi:hypothetical protein